MISKTTAKSLWSRRRLAVMAGLLALPGCAQYHLTIPSSDPNQPEGQASAYQTETTNAYAWGLMLDPAGRGGRQMHRRHQRRLRRSQLRAGPGQRGDARPVDAGGSAVPLQGAGDAGRRLPGPAEPVTPAVFERASNEKGRDHGERTQLLQEEDPGAGAPPGLHPGARRRIRLPRPTRHQDAVRHLQRRDQGTAGHHQDLRPGRQAAARARQSVVAEHGRGHRRPPDRHHDPAGGLRGTEGADRSRPTPATLPSCASSSAATRCRRSTTICSRPACR